MQQKEIVFLYRFMIFVCYQITDCEIVFHQQCLDVMLFAFLKKGLGTY